MDKSINILDFFLLILKWKKFFIINVGIITLAAIIISLILPKYYISTGSILPKNEQSSILQKAMSSMPMGDMLGNLGNASKYFSGGEDLTTKLVTIIKSRRIKLKMIDEFDLIKEYDFDNSNQYFIEDVLETVTEHLYFSETEEGALTIGAGNESPEKAQKMATYLINQLDTIYRDLRTKKLKNNLEFLENRKDTYKNEVTQLENQYKEYQEEHNIIDVSSQANATVTAAKHIESEHMIVQKKISVLKKIYGNNNLRINRLKEELQALNNQRSHLMSKRYSGFLLPLEKTPEYMLHFNRLKRDLKIKETLYSFILQEYETAKVELKRQTPVLQKLDPPNLPEKREKPKRKFLVIIVFSIAVFESIIIIKLLDYYKKEKENNTESFRKLTKIKNEFLDLVPFSKN